MADLRDSFILPPFDRSRSNSRAPVNGELTVQRLAYSLSRSRSSPRNTRNCANVRVSPPVAVSMFQHTVFATIRRSAPVRRSRPGPAVHCRPARGPRARCRSRPSRSMTGPRLEAAPSGHLPQRLAMRRRCVCLPHRRRLSLLTGQQQCPLTTGPGLEAAFTMLPPKRLVSRAPTIAFARRISGGHGGLRRSRGERRDQQQLI